MSQVNEGENVFEQLTRMAMEAATQGKWDSVAQFYDRRASAGSLDTVPRDVAKKLMQNDQWIMNRIREVQALTQQQLGEVQQHRRRLEGLKRQWAGQTPVQARHRLSI
jgi:tRNA A37 N6-isopentenylltransferase MiaA